MENPTVDRLVTAARAMHDLQANQLPVVEDGVLRGFLTRESVVRVLKSHRMLSGR